jgi:hypothetical protein
MKLHSRPQIQDFKQSAFCTELGEHGSPLDSCLRIGAIYVNIICKQ